MHRSKSCREASRARVFVGVVSANDAATTMIQQGDWIAVRRLARRMMRGAELLNCRQFQKKSKS